jgi:hypothetical protein
MALIQVGVVRALSNGHGDRLGSTLKPVAPQVALFPTDNESDFVFQDPEMLQKFCDSTNAYNVQRDIENYLSDAQGLSRAERTMWIEVYTAYWKALAEKLAIDSGYTSDWTVVYERWRDLANAVIRGYSAGHFAAWTIPCLYTVGRYLRVFAIKADAYGKSSKNGGFSAAMSDDIAGDFGKNEKLEDAARLINRMFQLCISDRAPLEDSRKWGVYYISNLLFKTYFKLNSIGLSKNILRALQATRGDMPEMQAFPKSHIVTFKYYVGVISFLEENYAQAEESLTDAWQMCHPQSHHNKELILTYLIPCHLLTKHTLPSQKLLTPYPRLQELFTDLCRCIKQGDLAGFDAALEAGEDEFVKRRIYLTLERGRDIALRNLLRKVFVAGGFETGKGGNPVRRSRIPLAEFAVAIRLGNRKLNTMVDNDEVECLLANMIYKNLMKGYISRERAIVVLSSTAAFPGTGV